MSDAGLGPQVPQSAFVLALDANCMGHGRFSFKQLDKTDDVLIAQEFEDVEVLLTFPTHEAPNHVLFVENLSKRRPAEQGRRTDTGARPPRRRCSQAQGS